jgi:hypothetical protein
MFNNRIVIAQKELFISIFSAVGKNYNDYKEIVNKYNSVFKPLAAWMLARDSDENAINDIVSHLTQYINRKKLNPGNIKVSKSFVVINDQQFDDLMALIDFVHGNFPIAKKQEDNVQQSETSHTPILTGDGIKVFKVEKAQDSKQLAGDTSWCIAYPGENNMWQSYRSNQAATFYIVWDENPPTPNQRKVALQFNNNNVQITDIPNRTGSNLSDDISFQYEGKMITGRDIPTYLTYLKSKGLDIDATTTNPETGEEEKILINKPLTPEEKLETGLGNYVKRQDINVDDVKSWSTGKFVLRSTTKDGFIKDNGDNTYLLSNQRYVVKPIEIPEEMIAEKSHLGKSAGMLPSDSTAHLLESITIESDSVKTYLSKFIGMGWMMSDDIVNYLIDVPGGKDYLVQYVNTGLKLPSTQIEKIQTDKQLFNSYVKQQLTAWEMNQNNGEVLKYLDPNNPSDKEKVLKAFSKTRNFSGIPNNWKENVPQIGVSVAGIGYDLTFNDPLAQKLAIAKGMFKVYQRNPTLENTRIYLHTPEAIEPLRAQAEAEGYNLAILVSPSNFGFFAGRFSLIPDEFKSLPEFYELSKIAQVSYPPSRNNFIQKIRSKDESEITQDDLETGVALVLESGAGVTYTELDNSEKFWNYLYDNFERYFSGRFSRIGLEKREIPDDVDEDDEDFDEEEFPTYENPFEQKFEIDQKLRIIPKKLLLDPDLREKFLKRFSTKLLINKLVDSPHSEQCINLAAEYVNGIQDIPGSIAMYLTYNKNPITEKILRTSSLDEYNNYMKRNRSQLDIRDYARLLNFYPFISDQITDQILLKEWMKLEYLNTTEKFEVFNSLMNTRPDFFRNHWQEIDLLPVWIYDLKEKNIIGTQNPQPIQETDEQIQESLNNVFKNMSALPDDEDEDVLASVKYMLKIAQKLDFKKEYRLADKLTYILRKKI